LVDALGNGGDVGPGCGPFGRGLAAGIREQDHPSLRGEQTRAADIARHPGACLAACRQPDETAFDLRSQEACNRPSPARAARRGSAYAACRPRRPGRPRGDAVNAHRRSLRAALPSPTVRPRPLAAVLAALAVAALLPAQRDGVTREQMWYAPTAEDWKRPVLIEFQRSWEDALAVAAETGKPILICVNMDGEIASEHYAGVRYRSPEIAKLYEPYVCVIASTYRHNPRDHDEHGRRIPCPRF